MSNNYLKIFNGLPENVQDAILSEATAQKIKDICLSQGAGEDKIAIVAELVGDVLMGVIQESALAQKLIEDAHIGPEISKNVAGAISREILAPVKSGIPVSNPNPTEIPSAPSYEQAPLKPAFAKDESLEFLRTGKLSKPPASPTGPMPPPSFDPKQFEKPIKVTPLTVNFTPSMTSQITSKPMEQVINPAPAPAPIPQTPPPPPLATPVQEPRVPISPQQETKKTEVNAETNHDAPFIMHKEEEVQANKEKPSPYSVQRPTFYKPVFSEEYKTILGGNKTARVELGNEEEKPKSPEVYKTPSQGPRVVHYSEFRTEVSPFENQNQRQVPAQPVQNEPSPPPATPIAKPVEVHPNNVINLKDLPLK